MKVVILAGGLGTRLAEETHLKPKPMVEIGGHPMLWHIMNIYSHYGYNEFFIALGYKGQVIKDYFINYQYRNSNISVDLSSGETTILKEHARNWKVNLIDTGTDTMTGGRLLRLKEYISDEPFMLTYGDGVSNVDIKELVNFHNQHGKIGTVTAVRPSARFGAINFEGDQVHSFQEKPQTGEGWINGGFFIFQPQFFDYLENDATILEREPLEGLTRQGELMSYKHSDYWRCMDTIRDRDALEERWKSNHAPWKVWGNVSSHAQ